MRPGEHKGNTHVDGIFIFLKTPLIFAADDKITKGYVH